MCFDFMIVLNLLRERERERDHQHLTVCECYLPFVIIQNSSRWCSENQCLKKKKKSHETYFVKKKIMSRSGCWLIFWGAEILKSLSNSVNTACYVFYFIILKVFSHSLENIYIFECLGSLVWGCLWSCPCQMLCTLTTKETLLIEMQSERFLEN